MTTQQRFDLVIEGQETIIEAIDLLEEAVGDNASMREYVIEELQSMVSSEQGLEENRHMTAQQRIVLEAQGKILEAIDFLETAVGDNASMREDVIEQLQGMAASEQGFADNNLQYGKIIDQIESFRE